MPMMLRMKLLRGQVLKFTHKIQKVLVTGKKVIELYVSYEYVGCVRVQPRHSFGLPDAFDATITAFSRTKAVLALFRQLES